MDDIDIDVEEPERPRKFEVCWRNVLDCKRFYGHVSKLWELARAAGYPYILWNQRVWRVDDDGATQTDVLERDLEKLRAYDAHCVELAERIVKMAGK